MPEQSKVVGLEKPSTTSSPLKLAPAADLFDRVQELYDSIGRRAFEIFEENGHVFGGDLQHWFLAESELLRPVHVDVVESDGRVTVRAEVPGFADNELEVSVEPRRLIITGRRETREEPQEKKKSSTERFAHQILRVIGLPAEVDAAKASATLTDGVLELRMPTAAPARKIPIEVRAA